MEIAVRVASIRTLSVVMLMVLVGSVTAIAAETENSRPVPPGVHHILLEVSNMQASVRFYKDVIGLQPKSIGDSFSTLEATNIGVYLSTSPWGWKSPRGKDERLGLGMYPHFEAVDVQRTVDRIKKAGYKIVQEPKKYGWGTEAFVADPDGYTWALISLPKHQQ
jgi:predicted enzyme related to lactoylglutathione lyase